MNQTLKSVLWVFLILIGLYLIYLWLYPNKAKAATITQSRFGSNINPRIPVPNMFATRDAAKCPPPYGACWNGSGCVPCPTGSAY